MNYFNDFQIYCTVNSPPFHCFPSDSPTTAETFILQNEMNKTKPTVKVLSTHEVCCLTYLIKQPLL